MKSPFHRPRSIRAYLLALVAVTAAPLLSLLVHATVHEYRLTVTQGELRAHTLATATVTSTRALMSMLRDALAVTAEQFGDELLDPARCGARVAQFNTTFRFLPNVMVVRKDGSALCSTLPIGTVGLVDVSERSWFLAVLRGSSFTVGAPVVGQITEEWVVAVAVPVTGPDGRVDGVLAASVPLLTFQDLLAGVTPRPEDLITISNLQRTIVARSRDPEAWVGRSLPPERAEEESAGQGFIGTKAQDAEGVQRTWASVGVPEYGWTVHAGIPADEVLAPAWATVRRRVILGGGTILLVAFLAYLIQYRITSSLKHLVRVTSSAEESAFVYIPPGTPTEIVEVAEHFNRTLSARLRAEMEERRAKERFRSIVDNAVLGIYVSTEGGSFLEVNPAFATLMGYDDPEELLERGPDALYSDPGQREQLISAYRERGLVEGMELEWVRKDGTPVTVRLHGKVVVWAQGQRAYEIMVEDVTERRRLEEQLRMTQKMEAVGRLAGGLAHDLNNVLTVIRVNADLANAELADSNAEHSWIDEIIRATEGAQRLTRQLLSFSRRREVEPKLVRPNDVIRGVEKMLVRVIGENVRIEARLDPAVPWIRMDPGHLEQVLMNLTLNARDALPEGGRILIRTSMVDMDLPWERSDEVADPSSSWVRLTVEDDGGGMPPAVTARVFEPFFTTKDVGQGTGLGLSTAYALVTGAGGRIMVDSQQGTGTRFDIWLPAHAQGPPAGDVPPPKDEGAGGQGRTILLVEDNVAVRRAVQRTLEGAGYHVLVARDGEEGIDLVHGHRGRIYLVLTDVVMPNASGPELMDHVDRVRPGTPILFMSGYTADHPMAEGPLRKGVGFIPKPFEVTELLRRVVKAMAEAPEHPPRETGKANA